eukprot:5529669-Amphidinium_carterae.1
MLGGGDGGAFAGELSHDPLSRESLRQCGFGQMLRPSGSDFKCPKFFSHRKKNLMNFCKDSRCDKTCKETDFNQCCVENGHCETIECPAGQEGECRVPRDYDLCPSLSRPCVCIPEETIVWLKECRECGSAYELVLHTKPSSCSGSMSFYQCG